MTEVAEESFDFLVMIMVDYFLGNDEKRKKVSLKDDLSTRRKVERLEAIGRDIGRRWLEKLSEGTPHFSTELDKVKFICKEFWIATFQKQIDNLKTNNKGTYVLSDKRFRSLLHVSETPDAIGQLEDYIIFPLGIIKGAFESLGMNCEVYGDCSSAPSCIFTVNLKEQE
ncbi:Trafficking protein particle complex subunit 6B [Galdieria sulphuraria]|uniref:Trafficking protein particle complex subunit 6B n=1 Tax=Galdieria sulphuraria TaxID=130081 RepID=M2X5P8_GALSU|nr:uncharacterized protein Gasu_08830 [Galdieria sulphuraria]EME31805.1 hypothetical protein Gasu_08830 [Galdieria sulphuraria]GJD10307.1 Trafficking protein particle complex subunit 6B [Galdieria sulphuraria]|eukprot:XP_005708325.1 hypothetical protein Gasu_08830 [Galdieria sulphuraria]